MNSQFRMFAIEKFSYKILKFSSSSKLNASFVYLHAMLPIPLQWYLLQIDDWISDACDVLTNTSSSFK